MLPVRSIVKWPPLVLVLALAAFVGGLMFALSATVNNTGLPVSNFGQFLTTALFLVALAKTVKDTATTAHFLLVFSFASVVYYIFLGPDNTRGGFDMLWKYGIAYPVTIALVYWLVSDQRRRRLLVPALVGLAALGMALGYRSYALVCVVVVIICIAKGQQRRRAKARVLVLGGLGLAAMAMFLPRAMADGMFGREIQERTLHQSRGNTPLILGGRTEPPLSVAAISERPLLGWGSMQNIPGSTISKGSQIAESWGMADPSIYLPFWVREQGRISLHSIFFGSWVEGGVIAAVFPALLLVLFAWAICSAQGRFAPLIILVSTHGIWDVLFSPWGGNKSVVLAGYALLAAWGVAESKLTPRFPTAARPRSLEVGR